MEFPAHCLTNGAKIDGFSLISYRVYSLPCLDQSSEDLDVPSVIDHNENSHPNTRDSLRKLNASCRERKLLSCIHPKDDELWLFKGGEYPPDLDGVTGQVGALNRGFMIRSYTELRSGVLRASDLETRASAARRLAATTTAPTAANANDIRPAPNPNIKSTQVNASITTPRSSLPSGAAFTPVPGARVQKPTTESLALYELFVLAVVNTLSYSLSLHHDYLPLDFRIFAAPAQRKSLEDEEAVDRESCSAVEPVTLETLDIRLSSTGTLVISNRSLRVSALRQMPYVNAKSLQTHLWLSPGGRQARYIGPAFDSKEEDLHSTALSVGEDEQGGGQNSVWRKEQTWKIDVQVWLREHGISLDSGAAKSWLEVRIQLNERQPIRDDCLTNSKQTFKTILWPTKLCFVRIAPAEIDTSKDASDICDLHGGLEWLRPTASGDILNPLAFAEDWFAAQDNREQSIRSSAIAREVAKMSAEAAAPCPQNQTQSPIAVNALRSNNHADLQAASGFYPTPPDGVQSGGATAASLPDQPGVTPASAGDLPAQNGDLKAEGSNRAEDQTMTISGTVDLQNGHEPNGQSEAFKADGNSPRIEQSTSNEVFEELDEAMFGGNAVTEEDFSFFDEPDLDDLVLVTEEQNPNNPAEDIGLASAANAGPVTRSDSAQEFIAANVDKPGAINSDQDETTESTDTLMVDQKLQKQAANEDTNIDFVDSHSALQSAGHSRTSEIRDAAELEPNILSPPWSPVLIKQRLFSATATDRRKSPTKKHPHSADTKDAVLAQGREHINFGAVAFNRALNLADHKYGAEGRYWFLTEDSSTTSNVSGVVNKDSPVAVLPEIGFLKSVGGSGARWKTDLMYEPLKAIKLPDPHTDLSAVTPPSDDNSSGSLTEDSELDSKNKVALQSLVNNKGTQIVGSTSGVKRKRNCEDDGNGLAIPSSKPWEPPHFSLDAENGFKSEKPLRPQDIDLSDTSTDSVANYIKMNGDQYSPSFDLYGAELVVVAQIMTDQVISGTLQPLKNRMPSKLLEVVLEDSHLTNKRQSQIMEATRNLFNKATKCNLQSFLAIEDLPPELPSAGRVPLRPVQRRASTNKTVPLEGSTISQASTLFRLRTPHVRVQRAETTMDVLPSALSFWETFGLSPCNGTKNVIACCVYPKGQGVEDAAINFIERISDAYTSCRLGSHTLARDIKMGENGMIPVSFKDLDRNSTNVETGLQEFRSTCKLLGSSLAAIPSKSGNVLVYVINPFQHPAAVVGLSVAFASLTNTYLEAAGQSNSSLNHIALQIVPIDFITSVSSLVIPSQEAYTKLSLEVYDRCSLMEDDSAPQSRPIRHAPSIALAKPTPKRIGFKLSSEPPVPLLHETPCLHIAYSQSPDNRWVSAAWTDNQGNSQASVSYCLGIKGSSQPLRPFSEIGNEIWKTTLEWTATRRVTWRVFIAKVSVMERMEVDLWTSLALQQSQPAATIILLTANPDPTLSVHPPSLPLTSSGFNPQSGTYTTPEATPQPSTLSPDQFGNAATPSATITPNTGAQSALTPTDTPIDLDPDATLVDITDETWGLIPSHRLHNTHSLTAINPALVSGYLLKRASPHDERPFAIMSVNLLWVSGSQQQRPTAIMREVLGMYRGLSTLARAKGVIDATSTEPWHVAATRKAVEAVGLLM